MSNSGRNIKLNGPLIQLRVFSGKELRTIKHQLFQLFTPSKQNQLKDLSLRDGKTIQQTEILIWIEPCAYE